MTPSRSRSRLTQTLGAATVAYSVAIIAVPKLLAAPSRMTSGGRTGWQVATLIRGIGARDIAIGAGMMLAAPGRPVQTALALRILSDLGDAAAFGAAIPDRDAKAKIAGFAVGWAALNAVALAREVTRTG